MTGADLLVMGAYSHSWLREFLFGGVTRTVLQVDAGRRPSCRASGKLALDQRGPLESWQGLRMRKAISV